MSCNKNILFPEVFSHKTFHQILHVLHFVDNSSVPPGPCCDTLWKIKLAFDFLVDRFSSISCQVRTSTLINFCFCGKEDFFKQYIPKQVDILISKNQALQILYLKNCVYKTT